MNEEFERDIKNNQRKHYRTKWTILYFKGVGECARSVSLEAFYIYAKPLTFNIQRIYTTVS